MSSIHHESSEFSGSRRRFLQTAAGATAATLVAAGMAKALTHRDGDKGTEQPVPRAKGRVSLKEGETIRVGVIGIGGDPGACAMGLGHAGALVSINNKKRENVQVVALCDVCEPYLERGKSEIEKKQPGVKVDTYRKSADLIARGDIHGVVVATPEHWHADNAIEAILAGKDVYCEKPMTLNLEQAISLARVAAANPEVIVQVGTQNTQERKYHEARKMIASGAIGQPTFSQTSYCRNSKKGEWLYKYDNNWNNPKDIDWATWCGPLGSMPFDPRLFSQWRRYRKTSTGIIGDLLVHQMTPMMMALDQGWPVRVVATGGHLCDKDMENHDNINIAVQFETGHQMIVVGSTCNEAGLETMIRGHKGNLYLGDKHCVMRPERIFAEEVDSQTVECPNIGDPQDAHRVGWLKAMRTREKPFSSVELGLKVMVVVDLATRSMWDGGAYAFDPKTMTARKA